MATVERLASGLERLFILREHSIQPWKQLLGAMVGVEHDRNLVLAGYGTDVMSGCYGTGNGRRLVLVVNSLGDVG